MHVQLRPTRHMICFQRPLHGFMACYSCATGICFDIPITTCVFSSRLRGCTSRNEVTYNRLTAEIAMALETTGRSARQACLVPAGLKAGHDGVARRCLEVASGARWACFRLQRCASDKSRHFAALADLSESKIECWASAIASLLSV